jgi:hypothetical protein
MNHDERGEERLVKLIGARRAVANPTVLARARARIEARGTAPGVVVWLGKPAVLAGAGLLFVLCVTGALTMSQAPASSASETGIMASLLGEDDLGLPIDTNATDPSNGAAAGDSGEVTP